MTECCDSYGKCTQGQDCAIRGCGQSKGRAIESEPWIFSTEEMMPPDIEMRNTIFKVVACLGGLAVVSVLFLIF
jgi:hypothetical protein